MAHEFELSAEIRTQVGKGAARRMRRLEDKVPAVIYGAGKEAVSLTLAHNKILKALENEAFYSHILTIKVDGQPEKAVLRDIQRHPSKPKILHMDFQRISAKAKISMQVPLHFINEETAVGVKQGGGVIAHLLTSVEVNCLPADLPEFIEVDVAALDVDQAIHMSEIKLPKGVELVDLSHGNDLPIVNIHLPRAAVEEEVVEEAPETEVITAKAKEEETAPKDEDKKKG